MIVCKHEHSTIKKTRMFERWVATQKKMRIQFNISTLTNECLEKLCKKTSATKLRTVVQAFILVFVNISRNDDQDQFKSFESSLEDGKSFGFNLTSSMYLDIESFSKIYDLKPNEMSRKSLHLMLSVFFSGDKELKTYWDEVIFLKLQECLKVT